MNTITKEYLFYLFIFIFTYFNINANYINAESVFTPKSSHIFTPAEIWKKHKKAADKNGIFAKAKTYVMIQTGTLFLRNKKFNIMHIIKFKVPNKYKTVTFINGVVSEIIVYNQGKAWEMRADSTVKKVSTHKLKELKFKAMLYSPNADITKIFSDITVSESVISGTPCIKLECTASENYETFPGEFYIRKDNFLTYMVVWMKSNTKRTPIYISEMQTYKTFRTVTVADKINMYSCKNNEKILEERLSLALFKWNIQLDDMEFTPLDNGILTP